MILFDARAVRRRGLREGFRRETVESLDLFVRATREFELRRRHDDGSDASWMRMTRMRQFAASSQDARRARRGCVGGHARELRRGRGRARGARARARRRGTDDDDDDDDANGKTTIDSSRCVDDANADDDDRLRVIYVVVAASHRAIGGVDDGGARRGDARRGRGGGGGELRRRRGGDGFVGAPDFASDEYVYRTPDFAVDLASPLVAYRLVTTALGQKVPAWLDAIIAFAALGAAYVVFTDDHSLDSLFV